MPEYAARIREYSTNQGDIWDIIAIRIYGDERAMHWMQDANYEYRFVEIFPANVVLQVPARVVVENDLRPTQEIVDIQGLLPWR
jgi:hypothetical protein